MTSLELLDKFEHCADLRFKNDFGAKVCSSAFLIPIKRIFKRIWKTKFQFEWT